MYLLDSDYLINFLKGRKKAVRFIENFRREGLYTVIICVGEVLEGLYAGENQEKLLKFEELLKRLQVLEINRRIINSFALVRRDLRKKGNLIDNFDLLIAATCLAYNLTLVTDNISHFQRIPGIKIYFPGNL